MDEDSVRECITGLKIKNQEGFDKITQSTHWILFM
jgi:hypothetical protein